MEDLRRVVESMAEAARAAGVPIATGDTKVVNRGSADKLFITTSGVGLVPAGIDISAAHARPGDAHPAQRHDRRSRHGGDVEARRAGVRRGHRVGYRSAPPAWWKPCWRRATSHALRDPTRGGLAATLCEIAGTARVGMEAVAAAIPVREPVRAACELLGLDPLFVANEGKLVAFVPADHAEAVLRPCGPRPRERAPCSSAR